MPEEDMTNHLFDAFRASMPAPGSLLMETDEGRSISYGEMLSRSAQFAHALTQAGGPDDLAAILYTSGTTGRSKGAMLSHENLASNARVLTEQWRFGADDVLIHALPIFHTHGLFVAINVILMAGAKMLFEQKFD